MREKLIELTINAFNEANHICGSTGCRDCAAFTYLDRGCEGALIANILIANGVTVQKWIPVTERLPETTCTNLASCGEVMFLAYYDGKQWRSSGTLRVVPVKHWMPLPEPPKGE